MTRALVIVGASAAVLALIVIATHRSGDAGASAPAVAASPDRPPTSPFATPTNTAPAVDPRGFLYGRVTTTAGVRLEGRLRWGHDQESFWNDTFNGYKHDNSWLRDVPAAQRPQKHRTIALFGITLGSFDDPDAMTRPLVVPFADIARFEASDLPSWRTAPWRLFRRPESGRLLRVRLRNGGVIDLDRFDSSDFDDGVRVWDRQRGVVDVDSLHIRTIELLPIPDDVEAPRRLYGTVRTRSGDFTGFIAWDRDHGVASDELVGSADGQERKLRFDTIRSIARRSSGSAVVTLLDGRQVVLSDSRSVGRDNRGIAVDDARYGRVAVSWDAFVRVDFGAAGGSGPGRADIPSPQPLVGTLVTRSGRRFSGRLVFDLDESESTDVLDAPWHGVDYSIPMDRIAAIVGPAGSGDAASAKVTLRDGTTLRLERHGDLGKDNGGILVFSGSPAHPEYVRWADVQAIGLDRPPALIPSSPSL